jgi:hypothetical protein
MYKTHNKFAPRYTSGFTKKRTKGRKKTIEIRKQLNHELRIFREKYEAAKRESQRENIAKVDEGFDPKSIPRFDIG